MALTLEAIYRAHFAFVFRSAARLGGPGFDAEDAAQEVFLIAGDKLHTYDGTSAVTTWLFGIAINVVRRARRRAMVRRLFALKRQAEEPEAIVVDPDRVEVEQARAIAYAILDKLSAKHREVFILSEFEEMSCDEIAAVVECKVATVWSRLHYARKEFARRLAARGLGGHEDAPAKGAATRRAARAPREDDTEIDLETSLDESLDDKDLS